MITISKQAPASVLEVKAAGKSIADAAGYAGVAEGKAARKTTDLTAAMVHWHLADLLDAPATEELYQACRHAWYSARKTMMYRRAYHVLERIGAEAKTISRGIVTEDARPDAALQIRIEDAEERLSATLERALEAARTAKKGELEKARAHYRDAAISARRVEDTDTRTRLLDRAKADRNMACAAIRDAWNAEMVRIRETVRTSPEAREITRLKRERKDGRSYKHLVTDAGEELVQVIIESVLTSQNQGQDYGTVILTARRRIIAYAVKAYRESLVRSRWMSTDELAAREYGDQLDPNGYCDGEEQAINLLTLKDRIIAYGMTARHAGVATDIVAAAQSLSFAHVAQSAYQRTLQDQLRDAQILAAIPTGPEHQTERKTVMRRMQRRVKRLDKLEAESAAIR